MPPQVGRYWYCSMEYTLLSGKRYEYGRDPSALKSPATRLGERVHRPSGVYGCRRKQGSIGPAE